jgi:hypothetical protein
LAVLAKASSSSSDRPGHDPNAFLMERKIRKHLLGLEPMHGTSFVFAVFPYDTPFWRNRMRRTDKQADIWLL